jgi:3-oxoacyl-[acyl-carrier protein] reductase
MEKTFVEQRLTGKVALVTGGGRGIGRAISLALARAGCDVAVNYRERRDHAHSAVGEIQTLGRRAAAIQADVSHSAEVTKLVHAAEHELGPIEILVNNAGRILIQAVEQMTEESWNDMIASNLTSCFLVTQAVLPGMRSRHWGRIVNISSVAAQAGSIVGVHYAASKAGMLGLTRSYARVLAKEGITVNAITPALVATEMVLSNPVATPDMLPVGRFGDIEEVADVAVMLASNAFITGQTINVNGGYYMS